MGIIDALLEGGTPKVQKKKRVTLYVIAVTATLLALTLAFLLVAGTITAIISIPPKEPEDPVAVIKNLKSAELEESLIHEGYLLLFDDEHPYIGNNKTVLMRDIDRPQTVGGTNAYTIGGMTTLGGTTEAINAFNKMIEAFYKSSKDDNIYVSNAHNKDLGSKQDGVYVSGAAFELKYFSAAEDEDWSKKDYIYGVPKYNWIYNNAYRYGFISVTPGSSVFRYVGVVHSTAMKNQRLDLESYLESLRSTSPDSPLTVNISGTVYGVYFLDKNGEHKLPTTQEYTISGNNTDGYIVTVKTTK